MGAKISVVVVTYNRPKDVKETVKSLLSQSREPLEIILIDDASRPPLKLNLHSQNLKFKRFNKEVGLSNARNYGISIAKGEYIAFIDDDAIPEKCWIEEIQKGFDKGADILGGPVEPLYLAEPPNWWNEKLFGGYVAIGNKYTKQIWGTNMAIRKCIFKKVGDFKTTLGRQKGKLLSGEETEFLIRAQKAGCKVFYTPAAKVFHKVPPSRMTLKYIVRLVYYKGKGARVIKGYRPLKPDMIWLITDILFLGARVLLLSDVSKKIKNLANVVLKLSYLVAPK